MLKIKQLIFYIPLIICVNFLNSQTVDLKGTVFGNGSVEGIHIINKTSKTYATTNAYGVFVIPTKALDTIQISSIKYELKTIVITFENIKNKKVNVYLDEAINQLNEVLVGKILTGNLNSDIANSDAERPLDFYDFGLPGYTGKQLTQAERKLHDADHGTIYTGLGVNLNKLLNKISGRTKKLKRNVDLERRTNLISKIKEEFSEAFFNLNTLDEKYHTDFFYFCSEDVDFLRRCGNSDFETLKFLEEKLTAYKLVLNKN